MQWVIEPEYISLLVLLILIICNARAKAPSISLNSRLYSACLYISFLAILSNIASVYTIAKVHEIPIVVNEIVNTVYFILTPVAIACIAIYMVSVIYKNAPEKKGFKRGTIACIIVMCVYVALILTNHFTKWFFYFDANLNYQRGILNRYLIAFYLCYAVIAVIAFFDEKKNLDKSFYSVIRMCIIVSTILALIQTLVAEIMLSGTGFMCVLLILFICFQQQKSDTDNLTTLANRETFFRP